MNFAIDLATGIRELSKSASEKSELLTANRCIQKLKQCEASKMNATRITRAAITGVGEIFTFMYSYTFRPGWFSLIPPPPKKSIRLKTPSNEGEVLELLTGFQTTLKEYRSKCQNLFAGWQRGEGGAAGKKTALYVKYDVLYCCILQAVRRRMLTRRSRREDGTSLVL